MPQSYVYYIYNHKDKWVTVIRKCGIYFLWWFFPTHPRAQLSPGEDLSVPSKMYCCHHYCLSKENSNRSPRSGQLPNHKELTPETILYYGSSELFSSINLELISWRFKLSMKRNNQRHRSTCLAFSLFQYWPYGSSASPSQSCKNICLRVY